MKLDFRGATIRIDANQDVFTINKRNINTIPLKSIPAIIIMIASTLIYEDSQFTDGYRDKIWAVQTASLELLHRRR